MKPEQTSGAYMITKLMFRLLPAQVLLFAVGAVNGIVSGLFASNLIGEQAMSAVGLFAPINMLLSAVSLLFVSGATIICGKQIGKNEMDRVRGIFSLDIAITAILSLFFAGLFALLAVTDATSVAVKDAAVRAVFNRYLLGQTIGFLPLIVGNQLSAFLSLENKLRRTTAASVAYIIANLILNYFFVYRFRMGTLGLALASSLGLWVFFGVQAQYFFSGNTTLRFFRRKLPWTESGNVLRIGAPNAASMCYQSVRGLIVNALILLVIGAAGISAFSASDSVLRIFWAVPNGMLAVSRMLLSVSVGEEDKKTLVDVMRVAMFRFVPLMCAISAVIIAFAIPLTRLFYRDPSSPVYMMTVWGFRILPLCMPLSLICIHFICYGQMSNKQGLVHLLSILDGVICVAAFTALLIRPMGMNSVYVANVLNGVVTTIVIILYAWRKRGKAPHNMEALMVILPEDFGVPESQRMDLSATSTEEIVTIAQQVQAFLSESGIDERRALFSGLYLEEMAGNVVAHGFTKDRKTHQIDIRVVVKNKDVILRIKDDCVPFDPGERLAIANPQEIEKNVGIRLVFRTAQDVQYQNILGMNVLTVRI